MITDYVKNWFMRADEDFTLVEDCTKIDESFKDLRDSTIFLNQFYIESRYPDDYIKFSRSDAEKANESAMKIKEFVLEKIK